MKKIYILLPLFILVTILTLASCNINQKEDVTINAQRLSNVMTQTCFNCGERAITQCDECKAVCYCSEQCQKNDFLKHAVLCKKINKAQYGDLAHIQNIYAAYIEKSLELSNKALMKESVCWIHKRIIRYRQDMTCSNNPFKKAGLADVNMEMTMALQHLFRSNMIDDSSSGLDSLMQETIKEALAWVEEKTRKNLLVEPYGVDRCGANLLTRHLDDFPGKGEGPSFVVKDQWCRNRMNALDEYKQEYANYLARVDSCDQGCQGKVI